MTGSFPPRPRTNKGYSSTLITAIQHYSGVLTGQEEEETISRLERRKQNSLYAQMTSSCIYKILGNAHTHTLSQLFRLTSTFNKVAECKINIQNKM